MRRLIDTHSHLFLEDFSADLTSVVERAAAVGVDTFIMPNINLASISDMMRVRDLYPGKCYASIGLHPTELSGEYKKELEQMYVLLKEDCAAGADRRFYAIGEVGLDLYWEQDGLENQLDAFECQIKWALEFDLPVIVHARSAFEPLCGIMDKYRGSGLRGVFHCFSGGPSEAEKLMEYDGFMFGIGGVSTYRKSELHCSLPMIPRDRILTETDCPYLSPVPFRGRRNEPAFMSMVVSGLAEVWGTSADEVADVTSMNAVRLFRIQ